MRILLLGHREIASNLGISLLVQGLGQHDLRIALSGAGEPHGPSTPSDLAELDKLEQALCDQLDAGARYPGAAAAGLLGFEVLAERTGKDIEYLREPNSPRGLSSLAGWGPELILSVRYRKILHEKAISIPTAGVLNLHSGLLPQFRGVMATFHAMKAGEATIGSTLHWIQDRGIDTGGIIALSPIPVDYQASYLDNVLRLYPEGCAKMIKAVESLSQGKSLKTNDQKGLGSYYSAPDSDACDAFRSAGMRLFDGQELERICSKITDIE